MPDGTSPFQVCLEHRNPIPCGSFLRMSTFQHIPLGSPVPNSPHAVVVQLPTMADVIGYEERHPATMSAVRTGYPRFLRHPLIEQAAQALAKHAKVPADRALFPVASAAAARSVAAFAGIPESDTGIVETSGWALLHISSASADAVNLVRKIIQHIGTAPSSRQAEDWLVTHKARIAIYSEAKANVKPDTALAAVQQTLAPWLVPVLAGDILICRSGMNAFYAAFEAVNAIQRPRGRNLWIQFGWLYTDTTEILRKCLAPGEGFSIHYDVLDKTGIEQFLAEYGSRVAGIVTEGPTNPLIRTPDFRHLQALARKHGVICVADPSTSSFLNVDLLPYCDVLVTSLTKYAGHEGDVMLGALAVNPASPFSAELLSGARHHYTPAYWRDAARLALEMETMEAINDRINANTIRLTEWLERHPGAKRIRQACHGESAANYARVARSIDKPGCMITFELAGDPARFYNRIRTIKGPSFGTQFTIVSPFIYMAHYDLVTNEKSRAKLNELDINPELMRVSVGVEPFAELALVFDEALK